MQKTDLPLVLFLFTLLFKYDVMYAMKRPGNLCLNQEHIVQSIPKKAKTTQPDTAIKFMPYQHHQLLNNNKYILKFTNIDSKRRLCAYNQHETSSRELHESKIHTNDNFCLPQIYKEDGQYRCKYCDKKYPYLSSIKYHLRTKKHLAKMEALVTNTPDPKTSSTNNLSDFTPKKLEHDILERIEWENDIVEWVELSQ